VCIVLSTGLDWLHSTAQPGTAVVEHRGVGRLSDRRRADR
jgi:hypothetical protein